MIAGRNLNQDCTWITNMRAKNAWMLVPDYYTFQRVHTWVHNFRLPIGWAIGNGVYCSCDCTYRQSQLGVQIAVRWHGECVRLLPDIPSIEIVLKAPHPISMIASEVATSIYAKLIFYWMQYVSSTIDKPRSFLHVICPGIDIRSHNISDQSL